ncbi:hypothetical protein TCA2_4485 [Paenibacillus sp. TCA20]|uniref:Uncharacterized protein n=1 Tax=Paenibacillus urinalis TaxID=521520 RepID=A0ABY7XHE1_9BACL|nr:MULTISPECIES: hypothetical protein [Paenibacillus]WDI05180.1 hypothetical protein PUW25_25565 [Paenibacillus urinalis]GAK41993.1 hypothetical protein TCA2_4485 [Paenibacillus sp. TCA20]
MDLMFGYDRRYDSLLSPGKINTVTVINGTQYTGECFIDPNLPYVVRMNNAEKRTAEGEITFDVNCQFSYESIIRVDSALISAAV